MSAGLSTEARGFKIAVFGASAVAAGVTFANIIYYGRLRKDPGALTRTTATTMMWINIALFVLSLIVLIWSVWSLLFSKEKREKQLRYISAKAGEGLTAAKGYLTAEGEIIPATPVPTPGVKPAVPQVTVTAKAATPAATQLIVKQG